MPGGELLVLCQDFNVIGEPDLVNGLLDHTQAACDDVHQEQGEPECCIAQQVVANAILGNIVCIERLIQLQWKKVVGLPKTLSIFEAAGCPRFQEKAFVIGACCKSMQPMHALPRPVLSGGNSKAVAETGKDLPGV